MRIDRMLAITIILLNRDRITAQELAKKFEVSVRTIYRDIESINLAGIPIVSLQGNTGGFEIMKNYKIDKQLLTLKDMLTMISALKGINIALKDEKLDSAIEKITNLVPKDKSNIIDNYAEQFVIDILPWQYSQEKKNIIQQLHKAISANTLIEFSYRNLKSESSTRTIEAMTLIFKGYTWYLFGYCRLRKDFRVFRVSRINNLKLLDDIFERKNVSYKKYFEPINDTSPTIDLILKFDASVRTQVEDFYDKKHIDIQDDGSLIVQTAFPDNEWLYSIILYYGDKVEVLEPANVRENIREKAENILGMYQE